MNGLFPKIECRAHWMVSKDIVTENLKEKIINKKKKNKKKNKVIVVQTSKNSKSLAI